MKKKSFSIIITLSIFFILTTVLVGTTLASDHKKGEAGLINNDSWYINEKAVTTKKVYLKNGSKKSLNYNRTHRLGNETSIDVYFDQDNNEYRFNEKNELVGYFNYKYDATNFLSNNSSVQISETELIEKAKEHIATLYGNIFDDYLLDFCQSQNANRQFYIQFSKRYGIDDFILGARVCIMLSADGTVIYSNYSDTAIYDNFDKAILEDIAEESIQAEVKSWIQSNSTEPFTNYTITEVRLVYENDRYVLRVLYDIERGETSEVQIYYHELNNTTK